MDLFQVCSNYASGDKTAPIGVTRYLYVSFKQNSGERLRATRFSSFFSIQVVFDIILSDANDLQGLIRCLRDYLGPVNIYLDQI